MFKRSTPLIMTSLVYIQDYELIRSVSRTTRSCIDVLKYVNTTSLGEVLSTQCKPFLVLFSSEENNAPPLFGIKLRRCNTLEFILFTLIFP